MDGKRERAAVENKVGTPSPSVIRPRFSFKPETVTMDPLTSFLYQCMVKHQGKKNIEVEVRLCLLLENTGNSGRRLKLPIATPAVVTSPHGIEVGVLSQDFAKLVTLLHNHFGGKDAVGYRISQSDTVDVRCGKSRISYDSSGKVVNCIKKKRLDVQDIAVPGGAYDLRFSVNQEEEVPEPSVLPSNDSNYGRHKKRISFCTPTFTVDATEVVVRNGGSTFEVEVEGMFPVLDVTGEWVHDLLACCFFMNGMLSNK